MNDKLKQAFKECEKFIGEHTPEELREYEKSLNLNYDLYNQRYFTDEEYDAYNNMLKTLSVETGLNILDVV